MCLKRFIFLKKHNKKLIQKLYMKKFYYFNEIYINFKVILLQLLVIIIFFSFLLKDLSNKI